MHEGLGQGLARAVGIAAGEHRQRSGVAEPAGRGAYLNGLRRVNFAGSSGVLRTCVGEAGGVGETFGDLQRQRVGTTTVDPHIQDQVL